MLAAGGADLLLDQGRAKHKEAQMQRDYIYEEITPWPAWVWLILFVSMGAALFGVWGDPSATPAIRGAVTAAFLLVPLAMWGLLGRLHVRVLTNALRVSFGQAPLIHKLIPITDIEAVDAVRYSPLREFGGWGIRFGRGGKRAWTIRGNRAVRLKLRGGRELYVGSQRAELLAEQIRSVGGGRALSLEPDGE